MPVSVPKQGRKGPLFSGFEGRVWAPGDSVGLERLLLPPAPTSPSLQASPGCSWSVGAPGSPPVAAPHPLLDHAETKHAHPTPCSSSNLFLHESPLYETLPTRLAYTVNKLPAKQHRCPSPAPAAGSPPFPSCLLRAPPGCPRLGRMPVPALSPCPQGSEGEAGRVWVGWSCPEGWGGAHVSSRCTSGKAGRGGE